MTIRVIGMRTQVARLIMRPKHLTLSIVCDEGKTMRLLLSGHVEIIIFGLAIALGTMFCSSQVEAQSGLLVPDIEGRSFTVKPPAHATDIEPCCVDFELLNSLNAGDLFLIQLYQTRLFAMVDRQKPQINGVTIFGHFAKMPGSRFAITAVDDAAAGTFFVPGTSSVIRLRYGGPDGLHYLHKVDPLGVLPCAESAPRKLDRQPDFLLRSFQLKSQMAGLHDVPVLEPEPEAGGCGPTDPTFDVMIVYSDDARAAAGGTAAIRAEAINAVAITESTYLTCSVIIRTNIVSLAEVAYNESGNYQDHLERLTDPDDGILDGVHVTRDEVDADFVSLFVADDDSGGLGWCLADEDEAFCVVRWAQAADGFSLAHEMGHNIGCAHNPENADCEPTEIGYGHNFFVPSEGIWRHTVMAYSLNGSTRIPYYSSPSCQYEGVPTGTPTRDNLAVILSRQSTCEAFRLTRMDVWVDFNYGGSENGSNSNPFNTVNEGVSRTLVSPVADIPILHIKPGSRNESITINKPMFIQACGGTVTIGQ